MCTGKYSIYNRYIRRSMYVNCGKCPACIQAKADSRAQRIVNNDTKERTTMFIHLTYLNECCPYVLEEHLQELVNDERDTLPVFRDYDRTYRRKRSDPSRRSLVFSRLEHPIACLDPVDEYGFNILRNLDLSNLRYLEETKRKRWTSLPTKGKIGICYYPDVQNFFKKLKVNLKRQYNYDCKVQNLRPQFYCTSEYGSEHYRPHFHILLSVPKESYEIFKSAVLKSWTYAFRDITASHIEPAVSAASYAATYVNKPASFPEILKTDVLKEKHSYSQGYGMGLECFSLDKILESIRDGDMRYRRTSYKNGVPVTVDVPIPSYVIRRYFPKFKGLVRLNYDSLHILANGSDISPRGFAARARQVARNIPSLGLTADDCHKIGVSLSHKLQLTGLSASSYLWYWYSAHRAYASTVYRMQFESPEFTSTDNWYLYDNISDYYVGDVQSLSLDELLNVTPKDFVFYDDPNLFPPNVSKTSYLTDRHSSKFKQHHLNDMLRDVSLNL